jgi:AmmeMemoRadiSam system protein B
MTMVIHPQCVGKFFPAEGAELREKVDHMLRVTPSRAFTPKAIIVPHAGYDYSGPVAAMAYACLAGCADRIRRVVLLGTCHFVQVGGVLTTSADAMATPLGRVPIDKASVQLAAQLPQVTRHDQAHHLDHALAVQLPFLQQLLAEFCIVPFLVTDCDAEEVAQLLDLLWDGDDTLIVVSTDLSHNLKYDEACRRDRRTAEAIIRLDAEAIGHDDACGHRAIAGLLIVAQRRGLHAIQIDLRNSGNTRGGRDSVVGYGAFVLEPVNKSCDQCISAANFGNGLT